MSAARLWKKSFVFFMVYMWIQTANCVLCLIVNSLMSPLGTLLFLACYNLANETITHPVPDKAVEIAQGDFRDDSLSAVFNLLSFNTWVIMNQAGASKQSLVIEQAGTRFFFWMVIHSAFLIPVKVLMQMTVSRKETFRGAEVFHSGPCV